MMGKWFAVGVTVITLISVSFFVMHTWWMPVDIFDHGPGNRSPVGRDYGWLGIAVPGRTAASRSFRLAVE